MSALRPETRAILVTANRPSQPIFSNAVSAEQWEEAHTWDGVRVLPRTDGKFAVIDLGGRVGQRIIAVCEKVDAADRIARLAAKVPEYRKRRA